MSSIWGDILPSAPVSTDRSVSPDIDSISSVFSTSSEELDQEMIGPPSQMAPECDIQKDEHFYFQDDNVKLIVEKMLYNVPRTPLERHSAFFCDLFANPPDARLPAGWSQQELNILDQPVVLYVQTATGVLKTTRPSITGTYREAYPLYGTTPSEFAAFMSVLYPKNYARHDLTTVAEWTCVLKLATLWDFASVRDLAIERLHPLLRDRPVEMLVAARVHYVNEWGDQALRTLAERDEPLDKSEAAQLDLEDILYIMNGQRVQAMERSVASLRAHPLLKEAFWTKEETERKEKQETECKAREVREYEEEAEAARKEAERKASIDRETKAKMTKEGANRKSAEAAEREAEVERESVERKVEEEKEEARLSEEKADREAKQDKGRKEREETDALRLAEEALEKAERLEAERKAEEARIAKEKADREAEEERRGARVAAARVEEERWAKEKEREAETARVKAEQETRKATEAEEAIARQRALDKATRAVQQPPPSPSKRTSSTGTKQPATRPAPMHGGSSSSLPTIASRQPSQTSAPSTQHAAFAGVPTFGRPSPVKTQKAAPPATSGRASLWNRLSSVNNSLLFPNPEPQTPSGPAHQLS